MKKLIISTGTGRCGTTSIARLFRLQEGVTSTHEDLGNKLHWDHPAEQKFYTIKNWLDNRFAESDIVHDSHPGMVSYLPVILRYCVENAVEPHLIWMVRPLGEYVRSSMKWSKGRCHFLTWHPGSKYVECHYNWSHVFPTWDDKSDWSHEELLALWWATCNEMLWGSMTDGRWESAQLIATDWLNHSSIMRGVCYGIGLPRTLRYKKIISNKS